MVSVSTKINRPSHVVWQYFTTASNWRKWYGSALKEINPAWQHGAKLVWDSGGTSPIITFLPGAEIGLSIAGRDTTFVFSSEGNSITNLKLTEADPPGGPQGSGGLKRKVELEEMLRNLRLRVEAET